MPKSVADPYRAAIDAGDAKRIRALMQKGIKAHPLDILSAVLQKQAALIPLLKEAGADPNARDALGKVALGYAVQFRPATTVESLLKVGADPNKEYLTMLPLVTAAGNGFTESVSLLLQYGVEVNKAQWNRLTGLTEAVRYGHREAVELLLKAGADPSHKGPDGNDSFDLARKSERKDILAILDTAHRPPAKVESKHGSDPNTKPAKKKRRVSVT